MPRILLISSVDTYRVALAINLRMQGFEIVEVDNPVELNEKIADDDSIDAALFDADMLSTENTALLDQVHELSTRFPVALVSTSCDDSREEIALKNGAADFLSKSRSPSIVGKRLRLLTERIKVSPREQFTEESLEVGPLQLWLNSHRALWHGRQVPLTITEFKIVRLLASRAGEDFSYREIYDVVHGRGFVAGEGPRGFRINVRSLIRKIRNRFRDIDENFSEIENYAGYGYHWCVPKPEGAARSKRAHKNKAHQSAKDRVFGEISDRTNLETPTPG